MTLYALEEIICRVRALDPNSEHFRSECWEISARIIGQHANTLAPVEKDGVLLFVEALLMWEALLARQDQRAPSFAEVVQRLRASSGRLNPELPDVAALDVMQGMPDFPRLHLLKWVLQNWLAQDSDPSSVIALSAIEQLLKDAIAQESQSPSVLALNERARL